MSFNSSALSPNQYKSPNKHYCGRKLLVSRAGFYSSCRKVKPKEKGQIPDDGTK